MKETKDKIKKRLGLDQISERLDAAALIMIVWTIIPLIGVDNWGKHPSILCIGLAGWLVIGVTALLFERRDNLAVIDHLDSRNAKLLEENTRLVDQTETSKVVTMLYDWKKDIGSGQQIPQQKAV